MIKRFPVIAVLAILASMVSGCATPYMIDRRHDAADIFTATVGKGAGVKARIGPLATGLFLNRDTAGLRGGALFSVQGDAKPRLRDFTSIVPQLYMFPIFVDDDFVLGGQSESRHKDYQAVGIVVPLVTMVDARYPSSTRWPYRTQIEIAAGLGGTLRVGLNPGELLDFVLGWTTLDIFSDDLESMQAKKEPEGPVGGDSSSQVE